MEKDVQKQQYEYALDRIEELLPLVDGYTAADDKNAIELSLLSDVVIAYETKHFPIEEPTVAELIEQALIEAKMTQKELASIIGVSPSRISGYIAGRAEPTLRIAKSLCKTLNISPAAMLGM